MTENENADVSNTVKKLTLVKDKEKNLKKSDHVKYVAFPELDANKSEYHLKNDGYIRPLEKQKSTSNQKKEVSTVLGSNMMANKKLKDMEEDNIVLGRNMRANKKVKELVSESRLKQKQKQKEIFDDKKRFDKKLQREIDIRKP